MQVLLGQLSDSITSESSQRTEGTPEVQTLRAKIKALEKDLYFYKKTSRDLKQQLQREGVKRTSKQEPHGNVTKKAPTTEERETRAEVVPECGHERDRRMEGERPGVILHDSLETEDSERKGPRHESPDRDHQRGQLEPARKQ